MWVIDKTVRPLKIQVGRHAELDTCVFFLRATGQGPAHRLLDMALLLSAHHGMTPFPIFGVQWPSGADSDPAVSQSRSPSTTTECPVSPTPSELGFLIVFLADSVTFEVGTCYCDIDRFLMECSFARQPHQSHTDEPASSAATTRFRSVVP